MKAWDDARPGARVVLPVLGAVVLALAVTWPGALHLTDHFIGQKVLDIWLFVWNLWWVRYALLSQQTNPFSTRHLFYPDGTDLYIHTLSPLAGVLAAPFGSLWGVIVAFNVSVVLALAVLAWAGYWLVRRWTGPLPAAVAAFTLTASPWVLHQLRIGHLNLINAGWMVLALLLLLRALDSGRPRDSVLTALAILAATLVDTQFTLFLAVVGAIIAAERLLTAGTRDRLVRRLVTLATIGGLSAVLLAPLIVGAIQQSRDLPAEDMVWIEEQQLGYSADLLAYVIPQIMHPLWGRAISQWLLDHPLGAITEGRVNIGLSVLALAAIALITRRPDARLWGLIGLVALLLSLGPVLHVAGLDTGIPMPYALLRDLPLVRLSRTPARFALLVTLSAVVLAALGLSWLRSTARARWGQRTATGLTAAIIAVIVFEHYALPYPLIPAPPLDFATHLAQTAPAGAVLELPYGADDTERMYYQTVHERPIFEGYISRPPDRSFLHHARLLQQFMRENDQPDIVPTYEQEPLRVLATYGISTIVVYHPSYFIVDPTLTSMPSEQSMRERVQAVLGLAGPTWEDEVGAVYLVPPAEPVPVLSLGEGWHAPEPWPRGWMRWMMAEGKLRVDRPTAEPLRLRFTTWSFHKPRTLTVLLDARPVLTVPLSADPTMVEVPLPAQAGPAQLTLQVAEGADSPAALGLNADARPLALGVADVHLLPAG